MAQFEARVALRCSPEDVFDFLLRPENLAKISHPDMGLAFIDPPEQIETGSRLAFKIQGYGIVQQMEHEIVTVERPTRFVESQVQGPLKKWLHEHIFEQTDPGVTTVIDRIEYLPPGGLVGFVVTESKIRDSLEEGFDHRHMELERIFGRVD